MLVVDSGNWWVLVAAFISGAVGGLAAALILLDPTESTTPGPTGWKAVSVVAIRTLVGAIAAVAFLFFFPTEQQTTVARAGHPAVTITVYPFLKVIALALVVGTGGSAFLSSMRNQAMSFVTASKANQATATIRATSVTGLAALPKIGGQAARSETTDQVSSVEALANTQIRVAADSFPWFLDEPAVDPGRASRLRYAGITGVAPEQVTPVDAVATAQVIADAVRPVPGAVEQAVSTTLQDQVSSLIDRINAI